MIEESLSFLRSLSVVSSSTTRRRFWRRCRFLELSVVTKRTISLVLVACVAACARPGQAPTSVAPTPLPAVEPARNGVVQQAEPATANVVTAPTAVFAARDSMPAAATPADSAVILRRATDLFGETPAI